MLIKNAQAKKLERFLYYVNLNGESKNAQAKKLERFSIVVSLYYAYSLRQSKIYPALGCLPKERSLFGDFNLLDNHDVQGHIHATSRNVADFLDDIHALDNLAKDSMLAV